jgi:hypothetical protein
MKRIDKLFGNPTILYSNLSPLPEGEKKGVFPPPASQLVPSTLRPMA